jgi:hypothetical protein
VALVRTDVSEELSASFIRVTRIGELGTTLAVTRNRPPKLRFLQEPHGLTSQKTPFFIVTAMKTSNLTGNGAFMINRARVKDRVGTASPSGPGSCPESFQAADKKLP